MDVDLSNLTRLQRQIINNFIYALTNDLSVRSKNSIIFFTDNNLKLKKINNTLLSRNFEVRKMKNVGAKCVPEIENYISNIKQFIKKVLITNNQSDLISLRNKFLIQKKFQISNIPNEILQSELIFQVIDFLIENNLLYDEKHTIILKKGFNIFLNQKKITLDEISEKVNFTRERVRQLRKKIISELFSKLIFIKDFNDDLLQNYSLDIESDLLFVDNDISYEINKLNKTNFSKAFITYILSVHLKDSYSLVGNYDDVFLPKFFTSRNRHNWSNFYLVESSLLLEFDFTSFANDISNRLSDRIEESYTFSFKSYLSKFLLNKKIEFLGKLLPVCEKIINEEFEIYLDLEENITFKRNTNRQVYEYAYEALEHLGRPSKVKDIFKKVKELYPNYYTEEAKIRASMKRKNGFVPIGRKSVYGLKKWESELDNFKGGTIRDIVEEYLMQFNVPKHISDITEYVLKYRPKSNENSIIQNLKLHEAGLYIMYENSLVGLRTQKYDSNFEKIIKQKKGNKKSWEERYEILKNFVYKEKRLPRSSGLLKNENKLYRWLNIQMSKQKKGKLNYSRSEKLNSLLVKYPNVNGRRRLNLSQKYGELLTFVSKNHRLPKANRNNEGSLYQFFYKQRKLFDNNELDIKEEIKFLEVARLLQNISNENKRNKK